MTGNSVFLLDLPEEKRKMELEKATIMLSQDPSREIEPDGYIHMKNVRLLQLLPAGADHLPFA